MLWVLLENGGLNGHNRLEPAYLEGGMSLILQVYSAYAPQLAEQLTISSTQVNLVGTAGNLGMYLMGPLWGKLTDTRGARM